MEIRNKANFKIIVNDEEIDLYVVQNFELGGSNSIIVNESATGNSGVTYNTGRLQEDVPINGTLLGSGLNDLDSKQDAMSKVDKLFKVKDDGNIIQFVTPYGKQLRTNQYYIKDVHFNFNEGVTDQIPFTMLITENRESNVKTTQVNLVNYSHAEFMKEYYQTITGETS